MFLVKFFKQSFTFKTLLKNANQKLWKLIIYFILLILIANFPATYDAFKSKGSRLDFIIEDFDSSTPLEWDIPENFKISGGLLITNGDTKEYINTHRDITYIINKQEVIEDVNNYKNHIIFFEKNLVYIDSKGNFLEAIDYTGFEDVFNFRELSLSSMEDKVELFKVFAYSVEKSFAKDIVIFTVLRNNIIQIFINIIYVILLAALIQLFKFGYQDFLSFYDSVKFVILSLGLPAVLSFGIGLLSIGFAPVIFQLASGMTVMLVVLIFGKKTFV